MSSINTNTSAMTALQTLRGIGSGLDETKDRVSSGLLKHQRLTMSYGYQRADSRKTVS